MDDGDDRIVVFGAGGHARSVLSVLHAEARWHVVGLLEDAAETAAKTVLGHPVLGDRTQLAMLRRTGVDKGFVAIGDNRARGRIVDCLRAGGFRLISVIHPAAVCMLNTSIAAGSFVHALALVGAECEVGPGAIVQPFCSLGHESRIGSCAQFFRRASTSAARRASATTPSSGPARPSIRGAPSGTTSPLAPIR